MARPLDRKLDPLAKNKRENSFQKYHINKANINYNNSHYKDKKKRDNAKKLLYKFICTGRVNILVVRYDQIELVLNK